MSKELIPVCTIVKSISLKGEPSTFLYHIVKGAFEVLVNRETVKTLTPDDIFIGEISFLLNTPRRYSVRVATGGKLIRSS